jgi:hypothetical protein
MKVEDTQLSKGQVYSYKTTRRHMQKISIFRNLIMYEVSEWDEILKNRRQTKAASKKEFS